MRPDRRAMLRGIQVSFGRVVSVSEDGMGIAFENIGSDDQEVLDRWLAASFGTVMTTCCSQRLREAIDKTQELKPDLVVIDISMPQMNGIDATREIRRIAPGTKIIILTMHESRQLVFAARHAGADEVITKRMASESLISAIERLFDVSAPELVEDS